MQEMVWLVALLVILLITGIFLYVVTRSTRPGDAHHVHDIAYGWRARAFWALVIVGVVVAVATLRHMPYVASNAASASQTVNATGYQWTWVLDPPSVVAGEPVQFNVTAADVNHGFGIYDADDRLLAQVQAMPQYTNHLRYTFETPGTYRIMCLEYCGIAHHQMISELEVTAP